MTITFRTDLPVEVIKTNGEDFDVADAARASTNMVRITETRNPIRDAHLINYLMRHRHGSPFEHSGFTFHLQAPLFAVQQILRHRIASYNQLSARYTEVPPEFYIYPKGRPLVQQGSGAHPDLVLGDDPESLREIVNADLMVAADAGYRAYRAMIAAGAAHEVARASLPVTTYTSLWMTVNLRSLMNFLSLRIDADDNTFETKPQWELQNIAVQMEAHMQRYFPAVHEAFVKNGRVAP